MPENLDMKQERVTFGYLSFIFFRQQQIVLIILLSLGGFTQNIFEGFPFS